MTQPPLKADGIKVPGITSLMGFDGNPLDIVSIADLLSATADIDGGEASTTYEPDTIDGGGAT